MSGASAGEPSGATRLPTADEVAPAALAAYLARQRWSGARGAAIGGVRLAALVPLRLPAMSGEDGGAGSCALALVDAEVGGEAVRYQLPLVVRPATALPSAVRDVVCYVPRAGGGQDAVLDATFEPAVRLGLLAALVHGTEVAHGAGDETLRWRAVAEPDAPGRLSGIGDSRLGAAEQSNTSVLYGGVAILKLFRRLARGVQPDVEIGQALSRRGFAHVPPLLGVYRVETPEGTAVAGMVQALVPEAADAWEHAVTEARAAVRAGDADRVAAAASRYAVEAGRLGAVTRAMHDALAAVDEPDFTPRAATPEDVRRWADGAVGALDGALAAFGDAAGAAAAEGHHALRARRPLLVALLHGLAHEAGADAGAAIRHHGDYHLGQVLRGADGALAVIDFEGEPARPLAERRARHSPLRDVAGMLRSLAYAAAAALREEARRTPATAHDPVPLSHVALGLAAPTAVEDGAAGRRAAGAAADAWERAASAAFLGAYFGADPGTAGGAGAPAPPSYLPRARADADALLRIFELEKLFYELRYEVRNRPDWLDIPLRGLARLLEGADLASEGAADRAPAASSASDPAAGEAR